MSNKNIDKRDYDLAYSRDGWTPKSFEYKPRFWDWELTRKYGGGAIRALYETIKNHYHTSRVLIPFSEVYNLLLWHSDSKIPPLSEEIPAEKSLILTFPKEIINLILNELNSFDKVSLKGVCKHLRELKTECFYIQKFQILNSVEGGCPVIPNFIRKWCAFFIRKGSYLVQFRGSEDVYIYPFVKIPFDSDAEMEYTVWETDYSIPVLFFTTDEQLSECIVMWEEEIIKVEGTFKGTRYNAGFFYVRPKDLFRIPGTSVRCLYVLSHPKGFGYSYIDHNLAVCSLESMDIQNFDAEKILRKNIPFRGSPEKIPMYQGTRGIVGNSDLGIPQVPLYFLCPNFKFSAFQPPKGSPNRKLKKLVLSLGNKIGRYFDYDLDQEDTDFLIWNAPQITKNFEISNLGALWDGCEFTISRMLKLHKHNIVEFSMKKYRFYRALVNLRVDANKNPHFYKSGGYVRIFSTEYKSNSGVVYFFIKNE